MWAPHIYKSQQAVLDRLPATAIEKLSSICTTESKRAAHGKVQLSKIGQRITESEALKQNRTQYLNASQPGDSSTWSWLTAAILVKVNEHHTQSGMPYFQISNNIMTKAPPETTHADVLETRASEAHCRREQLKRSSDSPSPQRAASSAGYTGKRAR